MVQCRPINTVDGIHTIGGGSYVVAGGHDHIVLGVGPHFLIGVSIYGSLTLRKMDLVTAEYDHVLVACGYINATAIAVVGRSDLATGAAVAREQARYIHAIDFPSASRALNGRIAILEHTFKCIRYIEALAGGAIKRARQILALVVDAARLVRAVLVNAVARLVRRVRAILKG